MGNDPFVGGNGFVEPRTMLDPGLVFDSGEADWDAFLADKSSGTRLNTASTQGPATLSVVVAPETVTVPAGASAVVTLTVSNTGARWRSGRRRS